MNYSYSGMFGPAGANPQTRELMHETQVAVEQEFNARTASIPQTIEVELAATRLEGPTNPLPPAAALAREVGVRNALIQRKSAEFQRQTAIANRFYGSDPLGKTFNDYLNQASANRRAHGAAVRSRALWSESFRAAHEARLLGQTLALLNQQQAGVLNWLATVQAQDQAQAAAAEAQRQAAEHARIAAEQQRQRDIAEAVRREQEEIRAREQARLAALAEKQRRDAEQARLAAETARLNAEAEAREKERMAALKIAQAEADANAEAAALAHAAEQARLQDERKHVFPASGAVASNGPAVSFASTAVPLSPAISAGILNALRTAKATLTATGTALFGSPVLMGFAALLMPSPLGNGERFAMSVPLAELSSEPAETLREIADRQGSLEMQVGLGVRRLGAGTQVFVATSDDFHIRSSVLVLNAAYDLLNDVYQITLSDSPTDLLTWTPAISPGDQSTALPIVDTDSPAYSGASLVPVEGRLDLNPILVEGWDRFIIVFPADSGIEPLYVVFSSPYEGATVRGKYSGRYFNPEEAGGAIFDLDWRSAVVTQSGIDSVKLHIARLDQSDANDIMIQRLEKILNGQMAVTDTDLRYYTHEIRELERFRALGLSDTFKPDKELPLWNNAHTATLEDFKLQDDESLLYSKDAIAAADRQDEVFYSNLLKGGKQ
ncbi:S-type pyocin domain-containing protein [Pseudomonas moraviensis]|uniref:S-type pyocin domain-containing protein n=1 Tax=Pseudomonas moraviensis TaxID=321662 RepID=UPI0020C31952|nr:S-type pyocin domain-containing protein [Pseudomonas moraviensis]